MLLGIGGAEQVDQGRRPEMELAGPRLPHRHSGLGILKVGYQLAASTPK